MEVFASKKVEDTSDSKSDHFFQQNQTKLDLDVLQAP